MIHRPFDQAPAPAVVAGLYKEVAMTRHLPITETKMDVRDSGIVLSTTTGYPLFEIENSRQEKRLMHRVHDLGQSLHQAVYAEWENSLQPVFIRKIKEFFS